SQPPKNGPLTSQRSRFPSAVNTKAPLRVPTSTRTLLIARFLPELRHALHPRRAIRCIVDQTDSRSTDRPPGPQPTVQIGAQFLMVRVGNGALVFYAVLIALAASGRSRSAAAQSQPLTEVGNDACAA